MKLNFVFTTLLLLTATQYCMGGIPTITGIQPESGPLGTPVVITGTDFGTDMANIEVFFGTIPAAISAITPSTLNVTVPAGAAHDLVVVRIKNAGWTVYSPKPFIVTFDGDGEIAASSFLPKVDLAVGSSSNPNNLVSGDLDGDGKVDLVADNSADGTISVFRNIASGGSLTASSFEAPLSLAVGGTVWAMAVADLNGDGKPEIIASVTSPQAKVVIFKNTSTSTAIAFSAKVEWLTNDIAYGLAVGDLDGDAWPEVVVPYKYYGIVTVYKNGAYYGDITAASFSTKADFTTGTDPMDVALGDFDGDGRSDMLVACKGNAVSVFRNLGAGSIGPSSFAAKVDFFAGTGPTSIALCDTDRDGKLDVVTSNINSYTLCLNRNLSTPGTIDATSFGPRQEFSTGFQPVQVAVADFDGDGYPDAATANNNASKSVAVFENSNVPGSPLTNFFFPRDDLTAGGTASGIVAADLNGDGKADIATSNVSTGTVSIFINNNTHTTPPPVITSFSPDNGNFRDVVVITGQNFSARPTDNLVKFNGLIAKVTASTSTSLTVAVPGFATTGKITVRVDGFETTTSAADFKVFQIPSISSIEPMAGPIGTPVTIHGANFSPTPGENIVYFGATRAVVTGATATQLTVSVPAGATYKPVSVSVHEMVAYGLKPFTVTFPGGAFTPSMFAQTTTFSSGVKFASDVAVGDLDGDGKPDVLMAGSQNGIAVFRNTSTGGAINSTTLAAKITVPGTETTIYIGRLELEDLDLDGKLDLIMASSTAIVFFRNISTLGTISFAPAITLQAKGNARVVVSDVDLDGKPDLVYGTGGVDNVLYIMQNTSVRGTLSFASPVSYPTLSNCFDLAVGDIDGDGKADIIYPNAGSVDYVFNMSVLRNQSTPLSIDANTLAAHVPFPVTSSPQSVALADFDGDGKTDIASGCYGYSGLNVLSALQNTSTAGDISASSFAPKTVWSLPSQTYALRAADLDGDGKPEMVMPICDIYCNISVFRNISSPGTPLTSSFEARKDFGTVGSEQVLEVADLNGDGRPELISTTYAATDIYNLTVFENKSTATYLTGFTPASGPVGTVVTITGNNFNATASMNQVSFNGAPAQVTQASTTSLTVVVPDNASTGLISITANGQTASSAAPFTVTKAAQTITFNSLSPKLVTDDPFVLNATASSGLPVEYASSSPEVATVSGNVVTLVGHGTTTITASQPGNAEYPAAEPVSRELTVNKLPQEIAFDALPEKTAGDEAFVLAGTASSGLPVTYVSGDANVATVAGNLVEIIAAGTTTLTARQEGNAVYLEAEPVVRTLVVKNKDVVLGVPGALVRTNLILPNPVQVWATVSLGEVKGNAPVRVQIFDTHGLQIMDKEFESRSDMKMDLSQLSNGIYIIQAGQDQSVGYWSRFAVIH